MVISNRAKFHFKIRWMKGYTLRVKFVFWSAAIKVAVREEWVEESFDVIDSTTTTTLLLTTTMTLLLLLRLWHHNLTSTHSSKLGRFNGAGVKYKLHT